MPVTSAAWAGALAGMGCTSVVERVTGHEPTGLMTEGCFAGGEWIEPHPIERPVWEPVEETRRPAAAVLEWTSTLPERATLRWRTTDPSGGRDVDITSDVVVVDPGAKLTATITVTPGVTA